MTEHFFNHECAEALQALTRDALAPGRHGDLLKWQAALGALPTADKTWTVDDGVLTAGAPVADPGALTATLQALIPWRKGPFAWAA